jgi:CheY-like chemotaxis protein
MHKTHSILIVEDEPAMLVALVDTFTRAGFVVLQARNGEEGLEQVEKNPDIVLLDVVMPKMDGIEMLRRMQADNFMKDIPVIILTNLSDNEKIAKAIGGDALYAILIKSNWKLEGIVEKVKSRLELTK